MLSASRVNLDSKRFTILKTVGKKPNKGATRNELATELGFSGNSVRPRVLELMDEGLIVSKLRKTKDGYVETLHPTDTGIKYIKQAKKTAKK